MQFRFLLTSLRLWTLAAIVLFTCSLAHASTIAFAIEGDGTELTGTLYQDTGTGAFTGSVTYTNGANSFTFNGSDFLPYFSADYGSYTQLVFQDSGSMRLFLSYLNSPYQVVSPSERYLQICSVSHPCTGGAGSFYTQLLGPHGSFDVADGDLRLTTPTPEPSSLALFGTGVLCVTGVVRRRFHRA